MQTVQNLDSIHWRDEKDLAGARDFEFIQILAVDPDYTSAFSYEMVRLGPDDHSVPHIERWNQLLYFVEGSGEIAVEQRTWPIGPGSFSSWATELTEESGRLRHVGLDRVRPASPSSRLRCR